jgi:hypothetical protein
MLQEGVLAILQVLRVRLIITEVSLKQNCDFFFFFFFFFFFRSSLARWSLKQCAMGEKLRVRFSEFVITVSLDLRMSDFVISLVCNFLFNIASLTFI